MEENARRYRMSINVNQHRQGEVYLLRAVPITRRVSPTAREQLQKLEQGGIRLDRIIEFAWHGRNRLLNQMMDEAHEQLRSGRREEGHGMG